MQSKASWIKRGMITQDLRSVGWIGIIYQITLLFALPLQLIMMHQNDRLPYRYTQTQSLFTILGGFQIVLMFTIPVILGVILFRYLHVKIAADFVHSLPVKRGSIYNHHIIMGVLLLVIPVIITAIIIAIVHGVVGLDGYFTAQEILKWAAITILMNVFVFVMTALIGTVTGISAVQFVLTYIFLIFPSGIMVLFYFNLKFFIFGFAYDYYFDRDIGYLTPIIRMAQITQWGISLKEVLIYIGLIIAFYLVGLLVYKNRQIEGATQPIAFRILKPIFKYGVTFCTMLLGGMYFGETQQNDFGWLLFGYFFGSIIGYVIAEMVLQKTWRVFKSLKWYVVYGVVIVGVGFLLSLDITGYEKKIPNATQIERVYFADSVYWLKEDPSRDMVANEFYMGSEVNKVAVFEEVDRYFFDEKETINLIVRLHEQLIRDKKAIHNNQQRYDKRIVIGYELKDGSSFVRQFQIAEDSYKELLKPIYESEEYKYSIYELLRLKENITIDKIRINSNGIVAKNYETTDQSEIERMVNLLKLDMMTEPYEQMFDRREPWGEIEILIENNQRLYIPWRKSYVQFDQWLQQNNLQDQARIVPADIDYAIVIKNDRYSEKFEGPIRIEEMVDVIENNKDSLKIEDSQKLEEALLQTTWDLNQEYLVAFYFKEGRENPMVQGLVEIPPFVEQYFK